MYLQRIIIVCLFLVNSENSGIQKKYKTVEIGSQTWMAENLDVINYQNRDTIWNARTHEDWIYASKNGIGAWCYYENSEINGEKYGILYNWYAVNDSRGLAPEGWEIPSKNNWKVLIDEIGGTTFGNRLKCKGEWGGYMELSNTVNFCSIPAGRRDANGEFKNLGRRTNWFTSTQYSDLWAWRRYLDKKNQSLGLDYISKGTGLSIRCIKKE